jgi:hypothetical protein
MPSSWGCFTSAAVARRPRSVWPQRKPLSIDGRRAGRTARACRPVLTAVAHELATSRGGQVGLPSACRGLPGARCSFSGTGHDRHPARHVGRPAARGRWNVCGRSGDRRSRGGVSGRRAADRPQRPFVPGRADRSLAPGVVERPASFALRPDGLLEGRPQEIGPQEVVMYKPRGGALYETPLEDHLRRPAFPRSCSVAATSRTARAPRSMKPANATFGCP